MAKLWSTMILIGLAIPRNAHAVAESQEDSVDSTCATVDVNLLQQELKIVGDIARGKQVSADDKEEAEWCLNGIKDSNLRTCCAASCGACGGDGCANFPGGASQCCSGGITATCTSTTQVACKVPLQSNLTTACPQIASVHSPCGNVLTGMKNKGCKSDKVDCTVTDAYECKLLCDDALDCKSFAIRSTGCQLCKSDGTSTKPGNDEKVYSAACAATLTAPTPSPTPNPTPAPTPAPTQNPTPNPTPACIDKVWPSHSCSFLVNTWAGGRSCKPGDSHYNFKHNTNHGLLTTTELCCASCAVKEACTDKVWPSHSCSFLVNTWAGGRSCQPGDSHYNFKHNTNQGLLTTSELCCASCAVKEA